jgi:hypothetical protein
MSRTPARVTQADIARAIRAAKQAGAGAVRVLPDGSIMIDLQASNPPVLPQKDVAPMKEFVL